MMTSGTPTPFTIDIASDGHHPLLLTVEYTINSIRGQMGPPIQQNVPRRANNESPPLAPAPTPTFSGYYMPSTTTPYPHYMDYSSYYYYNPAEYQNPPSSPVPTTATTNLTHQDLEALPVSSQAPSKESEKCKNQTKRPQTPYHERKSKDGPPKLQRPPPQSTTTTSPGSIANKKPCSISAEKLESLARPARKSSPSHPLPTNPTTNGRPLWSANFSGANSPGGKMNIPCRPTPIPRHLKSSECTEKKEQRATSIIAAPLKPPRPPPPSSTSTTIVNNNYNYKPILLQSPTIPSSTQVPPTIDISHLALSSSTTMSSDCKELV